MSINDEREFSHNLFDKNCPINRISKNETHKMSLDQNRITKRAKFIIRLTKIDRQRRTRKGQYAHPRLQWNFRERKKEEEKNQSSDP